MTKAPRKRKYTHWTITGTERPNTCLCLGHGSTPFKFALPLLPTTFHTLKRIGFEKDEQLVLGDGFYFPLFRNRATFDAFVYDAKTRTAIVFQVTVNDRHSVNNAGFECSKLWASRMLFLLPLHRWGRAWIYPFIEAVYHLGMQPVRLEQH